MEMKKMLQKRTKGEKFLKKIVKSKGEDLCSNPLFTPKKIKATLMMTTTPEAPHGKPRQKIFLGLCTVLPHLTKAAIKVNESPNINSISFSSANDVVPHQSKL